MKKRLVSLFLALTMTWGLTACAGGSSAPASSAAPAYRISHELHQPVQHCPAEL